MLLGYMMGSRAARRGQDNCSNGGTNVVYTTAPQYQSSPTISPYQAAPPNASPYQTYTPNHFNNSQPPPPYQPVSQYPESSRAPQNLNYHSAGPQAYSPNVRT